MGITHVLVNTLFRAKTPDYLNTFFVTHPEEQRRLEWAEAVFQDFIKERCTLLYSSGGVELYEINPSSAAYADNP
jgi:hypothetical protein